jgi:hypothetical protein
MKICPKCKGEYVDEYSFCPKDRTELYESGASPPPSEPSAAGSTHSFKPDRIPPALLALAIVVAAGLCLLVILFGSGLLNYSDNDDEHTTATTNIPPPFPSTPASAGTIPPSTNGYRYSFEDGAMGWEAQKEGDSKACVEVSYSDEMAGEGKHSLKIQTDLDGEDEHKRSGEVWTNMLKNPPGSARVPIDLRKRTVTAWVYGPTGSRGDESRPNGFQIFVKDKNWKAEYGSWENVEEGRWMKLSLTVGAASPEGGHVDAGFNPGQIVALGVKMGAGSGSNAKYKGPVYVDAVDW